MDIVRVGTCQTPEIISDPSAVLDVILKFAKEAEDKNVDLLLYPECFLTGYILFYSKYRKAPMLQA